MSGFGADWWPEGVRRPRLRMAVGLVLSGLVIVAATTAAAWLIYAAAVEEAYGAAARTDFAFAVALGAVGVFTATGALAAVLTLWALRRRSNRAFALAGAVAGAAFGLLAPLVAGESPSLPVVAAFALMGTLQLLGARWIGGVRAVTTG